VLVGPKFKLQNHEKIKMNISERLEKIYQACRNQKQAGVAILISDFIQKISETR
jgi:hypothetical protein